MPSILYSTLCYIKHDLYRLRIYIDGSSEQSSGEISFSSDNNEFTSVEIPTDYIKPSLTRITFEPLDEKKKSTSVPDSIILNHLLNIDRKVSIGKKSKKTFIQNNNSNSERSSFENSLKNIDSLPTPSLEQSAQISLTPNGTQAVLKRRPFSFPRLFSSQSSNSSDGILIQKTFIQIDYVDVSDSIRWNIKSLELEMDSEEVANELFLNLSACLSTLKQRPRRLLAFVNPFSGKGRARVVFDKKVLPIFEKANILVNTIYTERASQAESYILNESLTDVDGLICVGGDGMFAELCHGLLLRTIKENDKDINDPRVNLIRPNLRIGVIPAGSTDALVFGTTGLNDPVTSALQIIVGESLAIDITTVHNENGFVRFMATMLAYGFFGDIIRQSDRWRCFGPIRYDLAGFFQFIRNTSYHSELTITLNINDPEQILHPSSINRGETSSTVTSELGNNESTQLIRINEEKKRPMKSLKKIVTPQIPFCSKNCVKCSEEENIDPSQIHLPTQIKREGRYTTVNCLNMPCRCAKSKYGMSPFVHLGDGSFDLLLVKRSWRTGFLRFLWQVANDGRSIEDLPNVERYRVSEVLIRPIRQNRERIGHWSCDGELINGNEVQVRVHRQALNLFAAGIQFNKIPQEENPIEKTKKSNWFPCFRTGKKNEQISN